MPSNQPHPPTTPARSDAARQGGAVVQYDDYIESQIERTRRQVKGVEVLGAVLLWLAGAMVYLLLVALVDHWLVADGLGFWGRMLALAGFLAGSAAWLIWCLLPPFLGRVNPVYAAQTIEQHEPTLKNSLINFLLLRGQRTAVAPVVMDAIERRAADDLSHVPVEGVVDRSRVIRLGYVLMAVVGLFALYVLLSPKDPLRSVRRMMAPWSNVSAPTRVSIDDVLPGSVKAFHHDVIEVSAVVQGVREGEEVMLYYTTSDGQSVDRPIRMQMPPDSYRYQASLPEGSTGLLQNLTYYLAAGDVRTPDYDVEVLTAPAILVEAVEYEFPAYTGFGPRRVERVGDISGIEGTGVTIVAKANRDIQAAYLDFDCNGTRDVPLTIEGRSARGSFELLRDKAGQPHYESYQLLLVDEDGRPNPQPIRHRIEIVADQPPQVELVLPEQDEMEVPLNGAVTVGVRAIDPDFALRSVTLHAERDGATLVREPLLSDRHEGEFRGTWLLDLTQIRPQEPGRAPLAAGDTIEYWAEARDVRQPLAGRSETVHYRLKLVSPGSEQEREEQLAEAEQQQREFEQDEPPAGNPPEEARPPEDRLAAREPRPQPDESSNEEPSGGSGDESNSGRVDPEKDAGEAFDEILKHREEQQRQEQQQNQPQESGAGEEPSTESGEAQQPPPGQEQKESGEQGEQGGQPGQQQGGGGEGEQAEQNEQAPGGQQGDSAEGSSSRSGGGENSSSGSSSNESQGSSGDDSSEGGGENSSQQATEQQRAGGENADDAASSESSQRGDESGDESTSGGEQRSVADRQGGEEGGGESQEAAQEEDGERKTASDRSGEGAQARPQGTPQDNEQQRSGDAQPSEQSGGDPEGVKGESGAGERQGNEQGTPSPQESSQARDKSKKPQDPNDEPTGEGTAPGSPTISPKESDTQGGEEGDRSGGGQEGGGQKADQQGTGGAGQNTAADEGGSAAEGSGEGADSQQAGSKQAADRPTGQPGEGEAGQGGSGQSDDGSAGPSAGEGQGPGRPGEGGQAGSSDSSPASDSGGEPGTGVGGGQPDQESGRMPPRDANEPGGDDANLDYAHEATSLALEHLKDQLARDEPDPELLERLQWSRDDLQRFVDRWERLRAEAGAPGREGDLARERLDDSLRQLGLRRGGTTLRGDGVAQDEAGRMLESRRSRPPSEYADQFKAYTEGTSKGRGDGAR